MIRHSLVCVERISYRTDVGLDWISRFKHDAGRRGLGAWCSRVGHEREDDRSSGKHMSMPD
jgi:hypothetical protein